MNIPDVPDVHYVQPRSKLFGQLDGKWIQMVGNKLGTVDRLSSPFQVQCLESEMIIFDLNMSYYKGTSKLLRMSLEDFFKTKFQPDFFRLTEFTVKNQ